MTIVTASKLNEFNQAEAPARLLLERLGWTYVPREALAAERGDEREVLKGRLRAGQWHDALQGAGPAELYLFACWGSQEETDKIYDHILEPHCFLRSANYLGPIQCPCRAVSSHFGPSAEVIHLVPPWRCIASRGFSRKALSTSFKRYFSKSREC